MKSNLSVVSSVCLLISIILAVTIYLVDFFLLDSKYIYVNLVNGENLEGGFSFYMSNFPIVFGIFVSIVLYLSFVKFKRFKKHIKKEDSDK